MVRRVAAEPADDDAGVDAHLVQADRARPRAAGVEIGDQRQRGRNVERFADAHERPRREQLLVGCHMAGRPCHRRPDEQAAGDDVAPAEPVRQISADRAEKGVDPFEEREDLAPVRFEADVGDVLHHRELHRRQHLAIEVVQQRDGHEQRDDEPRIAGAGERGHAGNKIHRRETSARPTVRLKPDTTYLCARQPAQGCPNRPASRAASARRQLT